MEHYSALKRKHILTQATTWVRPEDVMLHEINQSQQDKHCMTPLIGGIWSRHIHRDRGEGWLPGEGEMGAYCFTGTELQFGKIQSSGDDGGMAAEEHECSYCHWTVHSKMAQMANYMLCICYHNKKDIANRKKLFPHTSYIKGVISLIYKELKHLRWAKHKQTIHSKEFRST